MRDKEKALETIKDIELTEEELKSFEWLLGWEKSTVENICSIIEKAKGLNDGLKWYERILEGVFNLEERDIKAMYQDETGFYIKLEGKENWQKITLEGNYKALDNEEGIYKMISDN